MQIIPCIILIDHNVGNVYTRFLDMPTVNIGTTQKYFPGHFRFFEVKLKEGFDFTIIFMSYDEGCSVRY